MYNSVPNEIEGFIRAPDNSPYRNGIFNFIIKIPEKYPDQYPEVIFKTKIFHTECRYDSGKCCIYFEEFRQRISLSLILIGIYEFFLGNNGSFGYSGEEPSQLYRKNLDLFNQKCQEYTKKYASDKFPEKSYLLEDYCDSIKEFENRYLVYDFMRGGAKELFFFGDDKIERIQKICNISTPGTVLLSGNNIYYFEQKIGDSIKSLGSNIIFIAPDINRHDHY